MRNVQSEFLSPFRYLDVLLGCIPVHITCTAKEKEEDMDRGSLKKKEQNKKNPQAVKKFSTFS